MSWFFKSWTKQKTDEDKEHSIPLATTLSNEKTINISTNMNKLDELFIHGDQIATIQSLILGDDFQLFKSTCIFQCLLHHWLHVLQYLVEKHDYKVSSSDIFDLHITPGSDLEKYLLNNPKIWYSNDDFSTFKIRQSIRNGCRL